MPAHNTYDCFQALADPNRREILQMLTKEKQSINAIAENFDISRPAVSKHIKVLEQAGFITITDQGRERFCELDTSGFEELQQWISYFEVYWHAKMQSLDHYLKNKKRKK